MIAILSNSIENARKLSENLQYYWNAQGLYTNVFLFEDNKEFCDALSVNRYECVVLQTSESTPMLVNEIREIMPDSKIIIFIDTCDRTKKVEIACTYHNLGVEMVLTLFDLEKSLGMLSKQLCSI